jgi:hypothetical protein
MFSLRNRFGIPGVISVIALVFAMLGGAYAANNNGGGKATASAKAKKGPRGPKGATGPAGPQGSAGPAGPAGPKGDAGAAGSNGINGTAGTPGKSVVTEAASGAECSEGGTKFKVEGSLSSSHVCNGKEGAAGLTETTLAPGKTLTGLWSFGQVEGAEPGVEYARVTISYPLRVVPHPHEFEGATNWIGLGEGPNANASCPGTYLEPKAAPGQLCLYAGIMDHAGSFARREPMETNLEPALQTIGWNGSFVIEEGKVGVGEGSWAVTAAE